MFKRKPRLNPVDQKERALNNLFRSLRQVSRFKDINEMPRRNGLYRADIKLSKYLVVRLIFDTRNRAKDIVMAGYMNGKSFQAINHVEFKLDVNDTETLDEGKRLEKLLYNLYAVYHHRIENAFNNAQSETL